MEITNPLAQMLCAVEDRIARIEGIRMIDRYAGQDTYELRPGVSSPTVLVDMEDVEYEEMGGGYQMARATLSVRLYVAGYASACQTAPQNARMEAMSDLTTERALVETLHGWAPTDEDGNEWAEPLIRMSSGNENRNDIGLRVRVLRFATAWEEMVVPREKRKVQPRIETKKGRTR